MLSDNSKDKSQQEDTLRYLKHFPYATPPSDNSHSWLTDAHPSLHTVSQAVKEVAGVFKQYTAIERIASVWRRVQELQGMLRTMLDEDFDAL